MDRDACPTEDNPLLVPQMSGLSLSQMKEALEAVGWETGWAVCPGVPGAWGVYWGVYIVGVKRLSREERLSLACARIRAEAEAKERAEEALDMGPPCESLFQRLVHRNPQRLIDLVTGGTLASEDLTFAAEILGHYTDSDAVRAALLPLLEHERAYVREGVVYGLGRHLDETVRARLALVAETDADLAVRDAAAEVLADDDWGSAADIPPSRCEGGQG
jgi:hypothetical protein